MIFRYEKVFFSNGGKLQGVGDGFAPLAVRADVSAAVKEFTRTLFVSRTMFNDDLRGVLGLVKVPCSIMQTTKDVSVPVSDLLLYISFLVAISFTFGRSDLVGDLLDL